MNDLAQQFLTKGYPLVLPREVDEEANRLVAMHSGERTSVERRPFRRQVDLWAFSLATALALGLAPREGSRSSWGKTFIYTDQGIMDSDLCGLLTVVAVSKLGHEHLEVPEPRTIIDLANRLSAAGCTEVLRRITTTDLRTTPLDRAIELARTLQDGTHARR